MERRIRAVAGAAAACCQRLLLAESGLAAVFILPIVRFARRDHELTDSSAALTGDWGKNGANRTPNHAIQCPLCIYASMQACKIGGLRSANTGIPHQSRYIPQHNRGVGGQIGDGFIHRIVRQLVKRCRAKAGTTTGLFRDGRKVTMGSLLDAGVAGRCVFPSSKRRYMH